MSEKLLFVFNPKSGKGLIKNHLVDIVDTMVKAGYEVTIYTTQAQGDAINKIENEKPSNTSRTRVWNSKNKSILGNKSSFLTMF